MNKNADKYMIDLADLNKITDIKIILQEYKVYKDLQKIGLSNKKQKVKDKTLKMMEKSLANTKALNKLV
ncbi:hypothetical protein RhiirA5_408736 [Rhizophagus irregularis]|uniref:Uncharacterized protein n=1 Tax=Rhizophagus irregularis TaxID=588596 RepID=A0A2I1FEH2_9GLOM|nr:hypothetical protein RhiirA5_408736 [Rhizophagus irregularis]PKY32764.1 hypothetical protein RhiirB3_451182 [Rhizophagus irregularis]GET52667.1 hypothetical protein RIR_jg39147.t1 [Rhizophagus irregularis DAOM 181602=DAOM 197198]